MANISMAIFLHNTEWDRWQECDFQKQIICPIRPICPICPMITLTCLGAWSQWTYKHLEPRLDALPQAWFRWRRWNWLIRNDFWRFTSRRLWFRRLRRQWLVRQHFRRLWLWRLLVVRRRFRWFNHWWLNRLRCRLDWLWRRLDWLWTFPIARRMRKDVRHDAIRCKQADTRHRKQIAFGQYLHFLHGITFISS